MPVRWLKQLVRRSLSPRFLPPPARIAPLVKTSARIEEQNVPGYHTERYYPVQLGQTGFDHYLFTKLGFGNTSTVWLARDTSKPWWARSRYTALKIFVNDIAWDSLSNEYAISFIINRADPSHPGAHCVCPAIDAFGLDGPRGLHLCHVYEPMRDTLLSLEQRLSGRLSPDIVKELLRVLLYALDYLHTRCGVVHTDLKKDHIFISVRNVSIIDDLVQQEAEDPFPRILDGSYVVHMSRTFKGIEGVGPPKLGYFYHAVFHDKCPRNYSIQPDPFRAPEVILGIPWSYSADIWNLGMLAWELCEMDPLLRGLDPKRQCYTEEFHLGEMMALLGRPPSNLLHRGSNTTTYFSPTGAFRGAILERQTLESRMHHTPDKDRAGFARFLEKTLQWRPEDRPSAAELLHDSWIQSGRRPTAG